MLVLFYFYDLGYSAFTVASLFIFYEIFGIVTNLVGGLAGGTVRAAHDALHGPRDAGLRDGDARPRPRLLARHPLRDDLAGVLGHRQGPDQDELQERRQAGRARGRPGLAVPLGRGPDRLEERAEGRRVLPRRGDADDHGVPDVDADPRRFGADHPDRRGDADARAPRQTRRQGEVQADVLQQPGRQRPGGRADLPVRLARRLVRRRPAGLPRDRAGLELRRDRRLPRDLGDRLRDRPGRRPPLHPRPRRQLRARGPHRDVARLRSRRLPGGVSRSRSPRESIRRS